MSSLHRIVMCVPLVSTMAFALMLSPRAVEAGYAQWIDEWRQTDLVVAGELTTGTIGAYDNGFFATISVPRDPSLLPELPGFALNEERRFYATYERSFQVVGNDVELLYGYYLNVYGFRLWQMVQSTGGVISVDFAGIRTAISYEGEAHKLGGRYTDGMMWPVFDEGIYQVKVVIDIRYHDSGEYFHFSTDTLPLSGGFIEAHMLGIAPVPEPSALAGLLIGLVTISGWARLRAGRRRAADAA